MEDVKSNSIHRASYQKPETLRLSDSIRSADGGTPDCTVPGSGAATGCSDGYGAFGGCIDTGSIAELVLLCEGAGNAHAVLLCAEPGSELAS